MTVACATTAFSKLPLEAALAGVHDLGFTRVDLLAVEGWAHLMPSDLVRNYDTAVARVDSALRANHLSLAAINVGFTPALHDRSNEAIVMRCNQTRALVRFMLQHHITVAALQPRERDHSRPFETVLADSAESLKEIVDIAEGTGVTFALECHSGSVAESLITALELLHMVPGLKVDYDPSHLVMHEVELEDSEPLLSKAAIIHLRDSAPGKMQTAFGEGIIDFDWLLKRSKAMRFHGDVVVEYLDGEGQEDVKPDILATRHKIEQYFPG
ncbi:MAG: sugar phosphate isomerase/epimerase [Chloroflexi bacterium]|nr:sugar phosphate isomerase/epimerase [Chloroflexota bacterium]